MGCGCSNRQMSKNMTYVAYYQNLKANQQIEKVKKVEKKIAPISVKFGEINSLTFLKKK